MKSLNFFVLALLLSPTAATQITFEKVISLPVSSFIASVIQTPDTGYAMLAVSNSGNHLVLIKTDMFGDTLWSKTYYNAGGNHLTDRALVQAPDGGFTFVVKRNQANLHHTSATGDSLWEKPLSDKSCFSLAPVNGNGYIATGYGSTISRHRVCRSDSSGNLLWTKEYQTQPIMVASWPQGWSSIKEVPDGGFIIAGNNMNGFFYDTPFLLRIGPGGDSLWYRDNEWNTRTTVYSMDNIGDQGFYVCGINETSQRRSFVMKLDNVGDTLWSRIVDHTGSHGYFSIKSTADGGAVTCGFYTSAGDTTQMALAKYDAAGNLVWERRIGLNTKAWGQSIERTTDQGYIIGGGLHFSGAGPAYCLLVKTDENGNLMSNNEVAEANPFTVFPNPAGDHITFRVAGDLPAMDRKIKLFDIFGKEVVEKDLLPGERETTLDTRNLEPGIYFYRVAQNQKPGQNGKTSAGFGKFIVEK